MVWACDEKIGTLRRREGDGMKVQGRRRGGMPKRRLLDGVRDNIKEKSADEVYDRATSIETYVIVHRPHINVGIR